MLAGFPVSRLPTFCYCCGLLGHSENFCESMFENPSKSMEMPYGSWLRASFRSRVRNTGERWIRPLLSGAFSVESSRTNDGRTLTTMRKEMEEIPEGNHNSKVMEEVLKNGDNHGEDLC